MFSTLSDIMGSVTKAISNLTNSIGLDMIFVVALVMEILLVIFFVVKSSFSYEASLNRSLDKLNYWLFERKVVTEENIKDLNFLFKTKAPKRLCYYWQQYILFREGSPSSYLSTENLIDKPVKTSAYDSNIKNLMGFSIAWALIVALFVLAGSINSSFTSFLSNGTLIQILFIPAVVVLLAVSFVAFLRARKNAVLNSLYQNVQLFDRFMDNACVDLPSYIDYQILFTPQEIEKGQPVLREFLDYKARKEKEEFNAAKEQEITYESYNFANAGVDGSIVLDRAMKESELFQKKKDRALVKISQLEAELDSRRKNFDNVQKDYQTKIQASKENIARLRQMQEETTNRIESNYYRKQQTQEIGKQEQYEQEFEQLRANYLLEKNEGEEEIKKLNDELEMEKVEVENAMLGEYQTFFDKFCHSAEKVVAKVFEDKINNLKAENEQAQQRITELEIKLKNVPQGAYDADEQAQQEGKYDENGNYVYPNGTFYDKDGNFHDENGNIYSQDGQLLGKDDKKETEPEKKVIDLNSFDSFDFVTDATQIGNVYDVAENIVKEINPDDDIQLVNNTERTNALDGRDAEDFNKVSVVKPEEKKTVENVVSKPQPETAPVEEPKTIDFDFGGFEDEPQPETQMVAPVQEPAEMSVEEAPEDYVETPVFEQTKRKAGRPRKVETSVSASAPARPVGRPKKLVNNTPVATSTAKKSVGRPKKIVKDEVVSTAPKKGRGRPRKSDSLPDIDQKLFEEELKLNEMRNSLNKELQNAVQQMDSKTDNRQNRRETIMAEIEKLQREAKEVMNQQNSETKLAEMNERLEKLINEISQLN